MDSSSSPAVGESSADNGSLRVFFDDDDDEESYFDLNINSTTSTDFCFTLALSPLRNDHCTLQDIFADGLFTAPPLHAATPPTAHEVADRPPTDVNGPSSLRGERRSVSSRSRHDHRAAATAPTLRRSPSRAAAATATVVVNFLIRFPSEKIRMAFVAFARSLSRSNKSTSLPPWQQQSKHQSSPASPNQPSKRRPLYRTLLTSLHKLFSTKERSSRGSRDNEPRIVDIGSDNSSILKAVAEAMSMRRSGDKGGGGVPYDWNQPRSAPCSLQSSPRHSWGVHAGEGKQVKNKVVERDGCVSSAIAHCKGVYV